LLDSPAARREVVEEPHVGAALMAPVHNFEFDRLAPSYFLPTLVGKRLFTISRHHFSSVIGLFSSNAVRSLPGPASPAGRNSLLDLAIGTGAAALAAATTASAHGDDCCNVVPATLWVAGLAPQ
jgi:hypothetical protein